MDEILHVGPRSEPRADPSARVERILVLAANSIWAAVGLLFWLPQIARVVVTSAARLVHAALTRQSPSSARGPIRRVSHFYVDGFMGLDRPPGGHPMISSRDLRLRRLILEALWTAGFYLLVLRVVSPGSFAGAWSSIVAAFRWIVARAIELLAAAAGWLPQGLGELGDLSVTLRIALAAVLLLALAGGWLLGRRR